MTDKPEPKPRNIFTDPYAVQPDMFCPKCKCPSSYNQRHPEQRHCFACGYSWTITDIRPEPTKTREIGRCQKCGHTPHLPGPCYNMASDNDCSCGEPTPSREDSSAEPASSDKPQTSTAQALRPLSEQEQAVTGAETPAERPPAARVFVDISPTPDTYWVFGRRKPPECWQNGVLQESFQKNNTAEKMSTFKHGWRELPPSEAAQFVAEHPLPVKCDCGAICTKTPTEKPVDGWMLIGDHISHWHSWEIAIDGDSGRWHPIPNNDAPRTCHICGCYRGQEPHKGFCSAIDRPSTPSKEQVCSPSATSSSPSASQSLQVPSSASGSTDDAWAMEEAQAIPYDSRGVHKLVDIAAALVKARKCAVTENDQLIFISDAIQKQNVILESERDAAIEENGLLLGTLKAAKMREAVALAKVRELEQKISDAVYSRHGANGMCCQLRENAEAKVNELTAQISLDADLHKATLKRNEDLEADLKAIGEALGLTADDYDMDGETLIETAKYVWKNLQDKVKENEQLVVENAAMRSTVESLERATNATAETWAKETYRQVEEKVKEICSERDQLAAENAVLLSGIEQTFANCRKQFPKESHLFPQSVKPSSPFVATMLKDHAWVESLRSRGLCWAMFENRMGRSAELIGLDPNMTITAAGYVADPTDTILAGKGKA